jgi:prepilin peptidase CpaA
VGYLILMTFPVAMAFAAANDLLTMKIPNWISLVVIGGFAAAAIGSRMPVETLGVHIALAAGVLALTFWLFSMNMLGGGDAKLMAAGALWMGLDHIVEYIAFITIYGGVLALIIMAYRRVPAGVVALPGWAQRLHTKGEGMPYGVAIAAASLMLFPEIELFRALAL